MNSWTPRSIRYERFLRENKKRLVLLGEMANVSVLPDKYVLTKNDTGRLFFSMSGRQQGMVWTFDGFLHNRIRGKHARLDFGRETDCNSFLVYSATSMYRLFVQLKMEYAGGVKTLHVRDLLDILVPRFGPEVEYQVDEVANAIVHVQKTILPEPDDILNRIVVEKLHLDPVRSPEARNTRWAFEYHAHHVTGVNWDHAQELEPLTFLTRSWLESSRLPLVAFRDIVSPSATSSEDSKWIYIPRNVAKFDQIPGASQHHIEAKRGWYKFCLRPNIDTNYICYYLRSGFIKDYLFAMSTYGHAFVDDLLDVPIVVPKHSQQILISQSIDEALNRRAEAQNDLEQHKCELQGKADALLAKKKGWC